MNPAKPFFLRSSNIDTFNMFFMDSILESKAFKTKNGQHSQNEEI